MNLSSDDRTLLAASEEIEIETRSPQGTVHRTIIWVVADGDDVLIRSVNGAGARWYREAVADPAVALHVSGRRIPIRLESATDPDSIERCSTALTAKYRADPALPAMLVDHTLATTLRVVARG